MIYAANFKTNHTRLSTKEYITLLQSKLKDKNPKDKIYIFPPLTALDSYSGDFTIGTQNAYPIKNGAFTGEIGLEQLAEFGIKTILIGHSERRHILGETQKEISTKFNYYKALGYKIVYCVGEPLEVKEQGLSQTLGYIWEQFDGIDLDYDNLILAYEPVWAIGTGVSATSEDIATIHKKIKKKINKPLLYGGSVKPTNLDDILKISNVDGTLIGTSSWNVEDFKIMIKATKDNSC